MIGSIAIIGANLAGGRAAQALRQHGFDGRITLIGEERHPPYERPPLSKEMLWPSAGLPDSFFLAEQSWYADNAIDLRLGVRAEAIDPQTGAISFASGAPLAADYILLATGGTARTLQLDGADAANLFTLRTKDEADRLARVLKSGARITVIGMGVIGAEVAASASKLGCEVTVIEPAAVPMVRTLGSRFGGWLSQRHQERGTRLLFGIAPARLIVEDGLIRSVECTDGTVVDCDAVVVGIGINPEIGLAETAGLTVGNGVVVDAQCRTSHPHVFAAGDVANQPDFFGGRTRLETYQNASDQATAAASAMLGQPVHYLRPCWFWSDQFDLNIQVTGRIDDALPTVLRGDLDGDGFSAFCLDNDVVVGCLSVNRAAEMGVARRMVEGRVAASAGALGDMSTSLRAILKDQGKRRPG